MDCHKRLAAQLASCSDALGTWLARAAIVGGAFMLRVPRGACSEKETIKADSAVTSLQARLEETHRNSRFLTQ